MTATDRTLPTSPTMTRSEYGVLFAIGGIVTVGVLPVFLVGGLAVQIRAELGLSISMIGLAGSVFFAASALVARALAVVSERLGPTIALRVSAIGSAFCLLGLAMAPSATWLIVVLCCAGVPNAMSQPAANEILMARIARGRRGLAFAVKQSAIPLATLTAGLAVPTIALTIGWRWVFGFAAVIAVGMVFVVPRLSWRRTSREEIADRVSTGLLLIGLACVTALGSAAANAMGTFVTISAVHVGYSESGAGIALAIGSAFGLASRVVAGAAADRFRLDPLRMVAVFLTLGAGGYILLALGHPVTFVIGLLLGFGAGWAWPGVFNFAVAARFSDRVTSATSVTQTGVYVGAAVGPVVFGLIADHAGTTVAWAGCAVTTLLATAILLVMRRRV